MLIFLYGEDSFRSNEKLKEIKSNFLRSAAQADLSVFDFSQTKSVDLGDDIFSSNLFSSQRMIVFRDLIVSGKKDIQEKITKKIEESKGIIKNTDIKIIFFESNSPNKNNRLFKFLNSLSIEKEDFQNLKGTILEKWIISEIGKIDSEFSIEKRAVQKLILYCGESTAHINSEIKKLINYCSSKKIKEKDIDKLVKANLNENVFLTIEALGKKDKKKSLDLLLHHFENGDDPFYLLSMFFFQFRNLILIKSAQERGLSSDFEIAKSVGLHPFVVKKGISTSNNFSMKKLKLVYEELSKMDRQAKTGKLDIYLALQKFVVDL